jgi:predicted nucleic acid-binding protein
MEIPKEIYLDTNMIHSWFRKIMENTYKDRPFEIPKILEFVISAPLKLTTTNITKAEILRYLKSEWNCPAEKSEELWKTFLESFNIHYNNIKEIDFDDLTEICKNIETKKKTLVNLIHLQTAKKMNMHFLTGEEILKEKYGFYYDKIITYEDLRKIFA